MLHGLDCKSLLKKFGHADKQLCPPIIRLKKRFKKLKQIVEDKVKHVRHVRINIFHFLEGNKISLHPFFYTLSFIKLFFLKALLTTV